MRLTYHPSAQKDINEAVNYYDGIAEHLGDEFWKELTDAFASISEFPTQNHFDASGLRRRNFKKFPYHVLFEIPPKRVRAIVVRHNRRRPSHGLRRK